MNNQQIIEKLFKVQQAVKPKNAAIASALERAMIPLLKHEKPLADLSRTELLKIKGIGTECVKILLQIINGATQYEIVSAITPTKKRKHEWL